MILSVEVRLEHPNIFEKKHERHERIMGYMSDSLQFIPVNSSHFFLYIRIRALSSWQAWCIDQTDNFLRFTYRETHRDESICPISRPNGKMLFSLWIIIPIRTQGFETCWIPKLMLFWCFSNICRFEWWVFGGGCVVFFYFARIWLWSEDCVALA